MSYKGNADDINLNLPEDSIVITCVQRFDSKSGQGQLVRAFDEVNKRYKNALLS